jgi:hypothetical protein
LNTIAPMIVSPKVWNQFWLKSVSYPLVNILAMIPYPSPLALQSKSRIPVLKNWQRKMILVMCYILFDSSSQPIALIAAITTYLMTVFMIMIEYFTRLFNKVALISSSVYF